MRATLTIAGLYHYDPTIFDNFRIPSGMDMDTLIFHICEECGFLEVMFPNPDYLRESIGAWSMGELHGWQRFWDAVNIHYDPLHNYDRTEVVNESTSGTAIGAKTAFDSGSFQNTDKATSDGNRNMNTRMYGNIGVTLSQQMLEAEMDVTRKLNIYKHIARDFKDQYCVLVY